MDKMCRTCLRVPDNLVSLHSDSTLINKIQTIASIQLLEGEHYPSKICGECVTNVNNFYNFLRVIINNDKELRERHETLEQLKNKPSQHKEIKVQGSITKPEINAKVPQFEEEISVPIIKESVKKALAAIKKCRCNVCGRTFTSRFKLYNHKRTEHVAPGVCNVCGMVVRSDNLKRHVKLHLETPVKCKECGKVFKNSESLRGHSLIHRGVIFTCELCGKTFKVKAEYKRHLKSHDDPEIGKVMCTLCGKRVRDMRKHMHSHTGERPYVCIYCTKGFTSTYSLKVHTRQHTNEKPFTCKYCPMAFPQKVSLASHLKSKHNYENV